MRKKLLLVIAIFVLSCYKNVMADDLVTLDHFYNINPSVICSFDKSSNMLLTQGVYFYDHYAITTGFRNDNSTILLTLIDLNTCSIIDQDDSTVMHHANDVTYNPSNDTFYIAGGEKNIFSFRIVNNKIVMGETIVAVRNTISLDYATDRNVYYARFGNQLWKWSSLTDYGTIMTTFPIKYNNFDNGTIALTKQTFSYYEGNVFYVRTQDSHESEVYNYGFLSAYDADTGAYKYTIQIPRSTFDGHLEGTTIRNNTIYFAYNVHGSNPKKIVFLKYTGIDEIDRQYNYEVINTELTKSGNISITEGLAFDYSKIKIKKTHRNNSISYVDLNESNCQINGFNNTKVGKQTVKVIYDGKEYPLDITIVEKQEVNRELKYSGATELNLNEKIDITKFSVIITYNNGTTKEVKLTDKNAKVDNYDKSKVGKQTIKVNHDNKTYYLDIVVLDRKEVSRELVVKKTIEIYEDDNFDFTCYSILIKYNDGSEREVVLTSKDVKVEGFDKTKVGKQKVKIVYEKKSYPIEITVLERKEEGRELVVSEQIELYEEDDLDITLFSIIIKYNNGTQKEIKLTNKNAKIKEFNNKVAGRQLIKIEFEDKVYDHEVNVLEREAVSKELKVKAPITVIEGKTLDLSAFSVLIKFNNNTQKEVKLSASNTKVEGFDNTKVGKQTIKLIYDSKEFFVDVVVKGKEQVAKENKQRKALLIKSGILIVLLGLVIFFVVFKNKKKK